MDFGALLYNAQKNKETQKEPVRYYSTKFAPPKKEQKDKARLSVNVKKFLEKKEMEEKEKREEAQRKKEELLALRSKDKKAVKRVNVMLKRTKSANQSVIQDAVDSDNTAVTLAGPAQPDEDDYGYVSQEADAFYRKMMEKYNKMPEETPKFLLEKKKVNTNLSSTKDRVRAALEKEKEEAMMPHKRKRKHKDQKESSPDDENIITKLVPKDDKEPEVKKPKIDKPRPKMPPPMNFNDLLKLAEKKQFEPIVIEKKPKEEESPLTKKQKREMEMMRDWQERKKSKEKPKSDKPEKVNKEVNSKAPIEKQSKLAAALMKGSNNSKKETKAEPKKETKVEPNKEPEVRKKIDWGAKHPSFGKTNGISNNSSSSTEFKKPALPSSASNSIARDSQKPMSTNNTTQKSSQRENGSSGSRNITKSNKEPSSNDRKQLDKTKEIMRKEMMSRPKQFPPDDLRPKQFPPPDVRRRPMPPGKVQMKKRRIMDDDDEDYDSEMDDFIDDGPEEEENYSKYIQEIFGYNKSKYRYADEEDDDDIMESSFAQQMKEEQISTKMGIMEDLEDIRMEEEHKKRKAMMKKKMRK